MRVPDPHHIVIVSTRLGRGPDDRDGVQLEARPGASLLQVPAPDHAAHVHVTAGALADQHAAGLARVRVPRPGFEQRALFRRKAEHACYSTPSMSFHERVQALPTLGIGISTEFGARHTGLDLLAFQRSNPELVRFLEIGGDLERGVDADARAWVERGLPTTYHFLDVNLEEGEDLDEAWIRDTAALAREVGAAWLCGDAGLWHVGPRERGHGVLMPPVLEPDSADEMARNVAHLREASGFEVLPENPPAHVFLGRMHLLDYFGRVAAGADCGLLLDVAHLAVYQRVCGHGPLTALDGFPLEHVVEVHVAGGTLFEHEGRTFVNDDHGVAILPETWTIFEHVIERSPNLKAIVFECERNTIPEVVPVFERIHELRA